MANPLTSVPSRQLPYGGDDKFYLEYPTGTSDTFVAGEMIAVDPSTGNAAHCDDSKPLKFMGVNPEPTRNIQTTDPAPIIIMAQRPRLFSMPLASGTISRGYTLNAPVFAVDSGHVQVGSAGLNYGNQVGYFFDVESADPDTWTGKTSIWISPEPIGQARGGTFGLLAAPAATNKTYGVEALNKLIEVPNTAAVTLTLPPIGNAVAGDRITFVKTTAAASAFTLDGNASETINGSNTYTSSTSQWAVVEIMSDGTQWLLVAKI